MTQNVRAAVSSSLLLLPQQFDASRFLDVVCGLSYGGDVRMGVGESYLKPLNIAAGQRELLVKMYAAPLADAVGRGHDVQGFREAAPTRRRARPHHTGDVGLPGKRS